MIFIMFDANIWISQLGLRSKNGAAVRFFARQHNATIAIPEVVQLEVDEHLTKRMLDLREKAEVGYRQLLPLFGQLQNQPLPSEDDIRNAVKNIIPDIDVPTRHIPLNLDAARSSMMKLTRRIPPSRRNEQFRDGVIWAHCLELLSEGDVYLISEDRDFFENADFEKGLALELVQEMEAKSTKNKVTLMRFVADLVEELSIEFELGRLQLFEEVYKLNQDDLDEILEANGFVMGERVEGEVRCFATERSDRVYVTFDLTRHCEDSTQGGRNECELSVRGVGFVDPRTYETSDVQLSQVRLEYPEWEPGGPVHGSDYINLHFNAPAHHSIRFPLESS